jgi:hypothetical protein
MPRTRRRMGASWAALSCLAAGAALGRPTAMLQVEKPLLGRVRVSDTAGVPVLRYVFGSLPAGEPAPAVEGFDYTHPLHTPSGDVVTDLRPADHPHHRGIFCGWVRVEGAKTGDWWGWGALAPIKDRRIVNNRLDARVGPAGVEVRADNAWQAEGETVLEERLRLSVRRAEGCNVADYTYRFTAPGTAPVVLAQNPFGGFCYRARPEGKQTVSAPEGAVDRPDAVFNKAETDWPSRPWYDLTYARPDGKVSGVAVLDHPRNPPTAWHVVRGIHMLNPCIVAGGPVTIAPEQPLTLRYRVVAHDGPADATLLNRLAAEFGAGR